MLSIRNRIESTCSRYEFEALSIRFRIESAYSRNGFASRAIALASVCLASVVVSGFRTAFGWRVRGVLGLRVS